MKNFIAFIHIEPCHARKTISSGHSGKMNKRKFDPPEMFDPRYAAL